MKSDHHTRTPSCFAVADRLLLYPDTQCNCAAGGASAGNIGVVREGSAQPHLKMVEGCPPVLPNPAFRRIYRDAQPRVRIGGCGMGQPHSVVRSVLKQTYCPVIVERCEPGREAAGSFAGLSALYSAGT